MRAWIAREARGAEVLLLMLIFLMLNIIYVGCMSALLEILIRGFSGYRDRMPIDKVLPFSLILLAFREELLFRAPLALLFLFRGVTMGKVLMAAMALSILFGFFHGGFIYILFQGVIGFSWCVLFLKCGGAHGRPLKAVFVTTLTHAGYNGALALITYMAGGRYF